MKDIKKAPLIFAVIGSTGKTTSVILTRFILERSGLKPAALDNWRGSHFFYLLRDAAAEADCVLAEVPLNILRQNHINHELFQLIAISNLLPERTGNEVSESWQYKAASRYFENLAEGTTAVFNADDPVSLSLAREGLTDFITYAISYPNAMIIASDLKTTGLSSSFNLTVSDEFTNLHGQIVMPGLYPVDLSLGGRHNVSNSLLSACICLQLGLSLAAIAGALSSFPGIRRNLELIFEGGFKVIDDAAQNPRAIAAALSAVITLPAEKLIILHGITGGGGVALNRANARELAAWLHKGKDTYLILTKSMYHCPKRYSVQISEEKAFLSTLKEEGIDFSYYPDLPDALESALWQAQSGDLVVLLGGPGLNRAAEMILRVLGERSSKTVLVPSAMITVPDLASNQPVAANPT